MKIRIYNDYDPEPVVVSTTKAKKSWDEAWDWQNSNPISRATGSQWEHETLYLSSKNRFYIVSESNWQGSVPSAKFVTAEQAAAWLELNDHELPESLESQEE